MERLRIPETGLTDEHLRLWCEEVAQKADLAAWIAARAIVRLINRGLIAAEADVVAGLQRLYGDRVIDAPAEATAHG